MKRLQPYFATTLRCAVIGTSGLILVLDAPVDEAIRLTWILVGVLYSACSLWQDRNNRLLFMTLRQIHQDANARRAMQQPLELPATAALLAAFIKLHFL